MSDKYEEVIRNIAVKHGVVLSKDDPILILQTMNERLIEETRQAQAAILAQFREEIESISSQWKDDANEKAEKVLNSALAASKEAITRLQEETTKESVLGMKKIISDSLLEVYKITVKTRKFAWFIFIGSVAVLIGFFLYIYSFL